MRANNRHQTQRIKEKRKWHWDAPWVGIPLTGKRLGIAARTPKPCRSKLCGNPRHYEGISFAEKRQIPA